MNSNAFRLAGIFFRECYSENSVFERCRNIIDGNWNCEPQSPFLSSVPWVVMVSIAAGISAFRGDCENIFIHFQRDVVTGYSWNIAQNDYVFFSFDYIESETRLGAVSVGCRMNGAVFILSVCEILRRIIPDSSLHSRILLLNFSFAREIRPQGKRSRGGMKKNGEIGRRGAKSGKKRLPLLSTKRRG